MNTIHSKYHQDPVLLPKQQPADCLTERDASGVFVCFSLLLLLLNVEWKWVYFYENKLHIVSVYGFEMKFVWKQWARQLSPPTVNRCNSTSCSPNRPFLFYLQENVAAVVAKVSASYQRAHTHIHTHAAWQYGTLSTTCCNAWYNPQVFFGRGGVFRSVETAACYHDNWDKPKGRRGGKRLQSWRHTNTYRVGVWLWTPPWDQFI